VSRRTIRAHLIHQIQQASTLHTLLVWLLFYFLRAWRRLSNLGILRGIFFPDRRSLRVHYIDDRRQSRFPYWLAVVHTLVTIITWAALRPAASPWLLPFIWGASISTTSLLWVFINRHRLLPE
jgi:hypothetical protein